MSIISVVLGAVTDHLVATIGWSGALIVLVGYGCSVSGRWSATSVRYLLANVVGSVCLGITAFQLHAWQSLSTNVLWLAFGAGPLARAAHLRVRALRRTREPASSV